MLIIIHFLTDTKENKINKLNNMRRSIKVIGKNMS